MTRQVGGTYCAACLMALALDEGEELADASAPSRSPVHAYQVVSVLGREPGRMRYLARRQDFHGFVSLEMIGSSALANLPAEAIDARLAQLRLVRHPGIARLLESWLDASGHWCLVSEYHAGRALGAGARLAGGTPAAHLAVFERVCDALTAAHVHGVFHGRLGPEAIVLAGRDADLAPRVTGFTVTPTPPTLADDLAGLCAILTTLTAGQPSAAQAALLADQAARRGATIETLRAAVAGLRDATG